MFNKAIILALLVGGLGVAVAGCEGEFLGQPIFGEPKKETVKPKKKTIIPKTESVRPIAEAAKPARGPFPTAGDTLGKKEMMGGRLSISVPSKYFISGSPLVVSIDAGKLSGGFYSRTLALRPYHPSDAYVWAGGTGRPVHDINLNTLSQTVTIGKDSPAADEYQDGDEIQVAFFEIPLRSAEPIRIISKNRLIYYEDSSGPLALLNSGDIDDLGERITIILPANAARAFPGIGAAVLRAKFDDKAVGIKLKVINERFPRKYPANMRLKHIFTVVLASQDDQKKWAKAHTIPRRINLTIVGRPGQRIPKINKQLTIRGTTY